MTPSWLTLLINSWPLLILVSIGLTIFGVHRMRMYLERRAEERAEEERKRIEFLKNMKVKLTEKKA